jgi:hypothetical protein
MTCLKPSLAIGLISVACAGIASAQARGGPEAPGVHSAAQLTARMRTLESLLKDPGWDIEPVHKQLRTLVTEYVLYQLNQGPVARISLEKNLTGAINNAMWRSWAEHPARVLPCCSSLPSAYVVAFVLDEAAGGSTSAIQIYRAPHGVWVLAGEGGSEINDCDLEIVPFLSSPDNMRIFAYGTVFGANQAPGRGVLYSLSEDPVRPIWTIKDVLGLRVKTTRGELVFRYRDIKLFYARQYPDAFRDVYAPTDEGLKLLSHTPLPPGEQ